MESDSLETDEVVAGRDRRGNGRGPRAVLCDHLTGSPVTVVDGTGKETCFVDLELNYTKVL